MSEQQASVHWEGAGKTGNGKVSTATGAQDAKQNCPLSKALAAVPEITLEATLRGA